MPKSRAYNFGVFTLRREQRALFKGEELVPLGARALDLLFALVESSSQVVSKAELMRRAWPDSSVDESTLRFHIGALRKALGDGQGDERYILNISGRGYCLVADVERLPSYGAASGCRHEDAAQAAKLYGRTQTIEDLDSKLSERRFVSVVGPGGMGKSTVALAAAQRRAPLYPDGIFVFDVSVLIDASHIAPTLAHQLGVSYPAGGAVEAICRWLHPRRALVLFDSCEAHTDACAELAKVILQRAPHVHVLTTSREALRVIGEWVHQLKPLAVPPSPWTELAPADVHAFPSVQLLLERARQYSEDFSCADEELTAVCELVARLDGMPLAIELAAAQLPAVGLASLLQMLQTEQFLRAEGNPSSVERHRTLEALFDWSHARLNIDEQVVLRRLSACNGPFTLDAAHAVAADHELTEQRVIEAVMGLEAKSLLVVDTSTRQVRYRLLDSTRSYAAEKLGKDDEYRMVRVQQCVYLHDILLRSEADVPRLVLADWIQVYGPINNDMRSCISWAFGPDGDVVRGVRLVASAVGFAYHLALAEEYLTHIERAVHALPTLPRPEPDVELNLRGGLFALNLLSRGSNDDMRRSTERSLQMADNEDNKRFRLRALNERFVQAYFGDGNYPLAKRYADMLAKLGDGTAETELVIERVSLQALHGLGLHGAVRRGLETVLRKNRPRQRPRPPFPIDMNVMARMMLVRILWLQGQADDALDLVDDLQHRASRDVRFALANAYAWSICPLHLWRGDRELARASIDAMYDHCRQIELPFTAAWACAYDSAWSRMTGEAPRLVDAFSSTSEAMRKGVVSELMATVHPQLATKELFERRRLGQLGWCEPEVLRAEGEQLLLDGNLPGAKKLFDQSVLLAREQGALSWELRSAISIARTAIQAGEASLCRAVLEPVVAKFHQGFDTADFRTAVLILNSEQVH